MKTPLTVRRIPPIHEEPKAKCYSSKNFNKSNTYSVARLPKVRSRNYAKLFSYK